jgi:cell division protein YceG involved in septum cleavage
MEKTKKNNKKAIITGVIILAVLIIAFSLVYAFALAKPAVGNKSIRVEIVQTDGAKKSIDIKTNAEYLRQALEEQKLIQGKESATGLYVLTVNGRTVDEANKEWLCFTKNGEALMTGVDTTPIKDGDKFEITFTVGW